MSDPKLRSGIAPLVVRWLARGWSIASLAFLLLIFVGEVLFPHAAPPSTVRDIIALLLFPVGTCVGMILGWRREGLGGSVTLASLAAFYAWLRIIDGRFPGGPFFALIAAPGLLFLIAWAMTVRSRSRSAA
jgi:hypothetical protein